MFILNFFFAFALLYSPLFLLTETEIFSQFSIFCQRVHTSTVHKHTHIFITVIQALSKEKIRHALLKSSRYLNIFVVVVCAHIWMYLYEFVLSFNYSTIAKRIFFFIYFSPHFFLLPFICVPLFILRWNKKLWIFITVIR